MQYAWLNWSLILLIVWAIVYFSLKNKESKKEMFVVSLWTSLLGLTEPLFVPEYWAPPSLFDLALKTGFDIESLFFAFGVGGLYVENVWNLRAISGILIMGIPLEELMFAVGLGFLWSSVYEHIKWRKVV